jgi:hypothetical protein
MAAVAHFAAKRPEQRQRKKHYFRQPAAVRAPHVEASAIWTNGDEHTAPMTHPTPLPCGIVPFTSIAVNTPFNVTMHVAVN